MSRIEARENSDRILKTVIYRRPYYIFSMRGTRICNEGIFYSTPITLSIEVK